MARKELDGVQLRFVEKPWIATLATVGPEGAPHTAPVWYRYEDGAFLVLTDRGAQKHRNIERDPRVELCIDDRTRVPYHTVIVRGRASVEAAPGAAFREALAIHYLGEEMGRRYVEQNDPGDAIMLRITPEEYVTW